MHDKQTTSLLRSIWETASWHNTVLLAFEGWVSNGASRSDVKSRLQILIKAHLAEQAEEPLPSSELEQVNWDHLTEFLCTCFYRKRLHHPLPDIPSDEVWMTLTDEQAGGPLSLHPQQNKAIRETVPVPLFPLEQRLLAHGGSRMVYRYEPDLKRLLEHGAVFHACVECIPGEPGRCHTNVGQLWHEQREVLTIATGYALSHDGLWRQHSWLVRKHPIAKQCHILETTNERVKYFGILLLDHEAEEFYEA